MKTRFSRLLSLLLAITMFLSCVPMAVGAEDDVVITIPTLVEGTVYETGTSIPLMVEHNSAPSTISHIDFYANGEKIPGNIPAGDTNKVLMWNKPLPGDYAVTAKIVYNTSASKESDPVNIKVSGTEQEVFRFGADDSGKWTKSAGNKSFEAQLTDDNLSSDYTDFSAKTFTRKNIISNAEDPFSPLRLKQDVTRDTNKYKYLNVLIRTYPNDRYVEGGNNELPQFGFVIYNEKGSATKLSPSNTLNEDEWTRLSFNIADKSGTFNNLSIFANGYNSGYDNRKSAYGVAIAGIFLSENATETMTATPLIPNGSGVSCEMPAYRLNFNRSLNSYLTKEKLAGITITTDNGDTKVSLDYEWGVDYLDLIPTASLELGKTYTVTIPKNTLYDNYANYVPAQTFTFKTNATSCEEATPIPYVTYPANGATVATEGVQLAAKVLFPPSDATDVVFYDNGTALTTGTVTKGTGNEFVLNDVILSAGEHTITAKVGDAISQPVTITAAATTKYETLGVQDGDRVILNPQVEGYSSFQNKITVVDFSQTTELIGTTKTPEKFTTNPTATNVSQVIFDLDGVITIDNDAPYEFPLTNAHQGGHTLKVHVLSNNGAVWSKTVGFTGIVGAIYDSVSEDYENVSDGTVFKTYATGSNVKNSIETYNGSKMYKIYNDGTTASKNSGVTTSSFLPEARMEQDLGDAKIFYVDFDYVRSGRDMEFQMHFQRRYTYPVDGHNVKFGKLKNNLSGTGSGHITMIMDCQNGVLSAYHNGTMYWYSKVPDGDVKTKFQTSSAVSAMLYVANVSKTSWMYVDNLNIRTYSSVAVGDYALSGITANSDLAANVNNYKVNVSVCDTANPETTTNLNKAVFKLNGTTIKTATEAPFNCEVPLKTLGANKLTVETTDSYGVIKTINVPFTVSFKVDGASITELRADPDHERNKAVVANPGNEASYILYTAVYTSDKALKTVTTQEIKIGANEIKFHEANVTSDEGETVRLFTWTENLYPLD